MQTSDFCSRDIVAIVSLSLFSRLKTTKTDVSSQNLSDVAPHRTLACLRAAITSNQLIASSVRMHRGEGDALDENDREITSVRLYLDA